MWPNPSLNLSNWTKKNVKQQTANTSAEAKSRRGLNVLIGLGLALAFIGMMELGARLVFYVVPSNILGRVGGRVQYDFINLSFVHDFAPDDDLFWKFQPNNPAFETNSQGFRGMEFYPEQEKDKVRMLCIGDSCTFGLNVPEPQSYPGQLQTMLDKELGPGQSRVVNAGVMGYSSFQGKRFLQENLPFYQPSIVVIYFGNNDLWPAYYHDSEQMSPSLFRLKKRMQRSNLFCLLQLVIDRARIWLTGAKTERVVTADLTGKTREVFVEERKKVRVTPSQFRDNYHKMIDLCLQSGALPILIVTPRGSDSPEFKNYRQIIRDVAEHREVPIVDAHRLLSELPKDQAFLEKEADIMHPTPAGHRIIASELLKTIESRFPQSHSADGGLGEKSPLPRDR